jgi:uncharacterized membrane protein
MTLVFGFADLWLEKSVFFVYEPCVTNLLSAVFFGASLFSKKTIIQEFRESRELKKGTKLKSPEKALIAYFRLLTGIWVAYFILKAGVYFWLASRYSIEETLAIRVVIGSGSLYGFILLSVFGSRFIFPILKRFRLLPST